jgi:hypothetical protein
MKRKAHVADGAVCFPLRSNTSNYSKVQIILGRWLFMLGSILKSEDYRALVASAVDYRHLPRLTCTYSSNYTSLAIACCPSHIFWTIFILSCSEVGDLLYQLGPTA